MQPIYQAFAADNPWSQILPEIAMVVLALALLMYDLFLKGERNRSGSIAIIGQLLIFCTLVMEGGRGEPGIHFGGLLENSPIGNFGRAFFVGCSILTSVLACTYLKRRLLARSEFHHITIIIAAAFMLLVQSHHFVLLFVALETATVGFYILVSYSRQSPLSLEAGLKYLILGALSSTILLFGSVLIYGAVGAGTNGLDAMNFSKIGGFVSMNQGDTLLRAGFLMIMAGLLFKVGALPFQIWIPDVYQGAPTPVTAYLSVASKSAGLLVMLQLLTGPFAAFQAFVTPLLSLIAILTIFFGNMSALSQRNVKRMLGLSGVAHAGYMLIGVIAAFHVPEMATKALFFYLVSYLLASYAVFGVMTWHAGKDDADQDLRSYIDFGEKQPVLSFILVVGLASLAGIPPLGGFIGKMLLFMAAYKAGLSTLLILAVVGVTISIYYYFGWMQEATFYFWKLKPEDEEKQKELEAKYPKPLCAGFVCTLVILTVATIAVGFFQGLIPVL
jgi:NADH-quinone oxidoreductase subunit N